MAPSEDPRNWRSMLKDTVDLETVSGGKPAQPQAIPKAHVTFIIDCARGKQLSLAAPPVPPQVPTPRKSPVTPSMKTYIVFCRENQAPTTQGIPLERWHSAQAKNTLVPCPGAQAPTSHPASLCSPQELPRAKRSPQKVRAAASSPWGAVKGSLKKALSSCVCGQAD
ncbi:steroid receptor-associated and regulated protein [Octodon degus]|uniref:Steroid receptor-associated and regulated protein n=1 Tax=Octodon degus TaxID=10160 RepID=A0A6P6F1H3_OCTDE|nr:steroid receptor-associated and regulated protein [Octodon degus]XP_023578351.1 steroid receptor-associated and regulated protein [Octodon degus]